MPTEEAWDLGQSPHREHLVASVALMWIAGSLGFIPFTLVPGTASAKDGNLLSHAHIPLVPTIPKSPSKDRGSQLSSSSCHRGAFLAVSWAFLQGTSAQPPSHETSPHLRALESPPPASPFLKGPSPRSPSQAGNLDPAKRGEGGVGKGKYESKI